MWKKGKSLTSILILLICISVILFFGIRSLKAADSASSLDYHKDVKEAQAIADASSGNCAEVDDDGNLIVKQWTNSVASLRDGDADATMVTGAGTLYAMIVTGITAGDYAGFRDATSAAGTPIFDILVGTALDTKPVIIPGGVSFTNGIHCVRTDTAVQVEIIYDQ